MRGERGEGRATRLAPTAPTTRTMNTYRLLSTPMVNTPGIVAWAINAYRFPRDRKVIREVMASYPGLPEDVIEGLLDKSIPYTVEGETVIIIH